MVGADVQLRPAKGIHIIYPHRISNFSISAESIDGRDLLMVSHAGFTLLGTTDDDFYGDLDSVDVLEDEVDYLLQAFERVFPSIRAYRPARTTTGVRPTLFKWRRYEDELSRRYEVIDHSRDGAEGFVTIAGGKLSMYRLMAEQTSDMVCRKLGHEAPCLTATRPLPGNESELEPAAELGVRFGITALAAMRLQTRQGSNAAAVMGICFLVSQSLFWIAQAFIGLVAYFGVLLLFGETELRSWIRSLKAQPSVSRIGELTR